VDHDAARLFDEHVDAVYGYVARRLGSETAADVVGDVFEIALSQSDRYEAARGSERAWLFGIATNLMRRHWRTEQRRLRATYRIANRPAVPGDALLDIAERIDAATEAERVMAAVGDLEPEDRDLLLLVAWEDTPYKVCAEILGVPVGTVRSRLHRIRRELRSAVHLDDPTLEAFQ
jgi:RNA polymerase sigma-70 factor (ECF subfamily)